MEPHEVIKQAIDGHAKGVALRMGKCERYVYKMMAEPEACRYTRFLQLFLALHAENPLGADAIFEDFRARFIELRRHRPQITSVDWTHAIAKVVKESGESINAALIDGDPVKIEKEIVQSIEAHRSLLELCVARAGKRAAGHEATGPRGMQIPRARTVGGG